MREKLIELLDKTKSSYEDYLAEKDRKMRMAKTEADFEAEANTIEIRHSFYAGELIANGVTVQEWIPVSERLPKPFVDVITLRRDLLSEKYHAVGVEYIAPHGVEEIPTWSKDHMTWKNKVTHWMPIPEPPKEG